MRPVMRAGCVGSLVVSDDEISVRIGDEAPRLVAVATTAGQALGAGTGTGRDVVVARVDGRLVDLATPLTDGQHVEAVTSGSADGLMVSRHSAAHVLAQAVQDVFPGTRLGIGPPIVDGFYYDFDPERPFTPEDLKAIEKRMDSIVRQRQRFARRPISDDDARVELAHEPYKLELIGLKGGATADDGAGLFEGSEVEVGAGQLTMYDNLVGPAEAPERVWTDLCRGPHVPTTRDIGAYSLTRSAAAYWRGSEANPQLQRIYGTAWQDKAALKAHLDRIAEAERRDHRRLGAQLDLFSFPEEIGSGLAVFHPKGGILRRTMEDYSRLRHEQAGYEFVYTPHITKGALFETSGHLQWYADGMFPPMHVDAEFDEDGQLRRQGQDYYLKPMNCPMHNLIYRSRQRSYRELPLRLFEFGSVYRYEKSGVVHGLTRVRGMTQDDAHIYCTPDQLQGEIRSLLDFVLRLLADYGLTDFYLELSTRNDEKYVGSDEDWEIATNALREAADATGLELVLDPGGAAFYAPKISVQARDAIGRTWQMSTIQVDFQLPDRFELEYASKDGTRQRPYMIHRALFGSIERFIAVLTEHYAGAFPPWLAPVQVVGIPVSDSAEEHLFDVAAQLRTQGIRVEVDTGDDRMQKKIRTAQQQKVPYMLIAGDTDVDAGAVSFRYRDGTQKNGVPIADAVAEIAAAVRDRIQV
jgi:threonyl-tRNA synthetase